MKKNLSCCLLFIVLAVLVTICLIVISVYTVAGYVADKLPPPLKGWAWNWILGEEDTGSTTGAASAFLGAYAISPKGSFYWEPEFYSGPASMVCRIPMEYGFMNPTHGSFGSTLDRTTPHTGIDYIEGWGNPAPQVVAVMGGKVTYAGWNWYLGWMVVVENNGIQTIYGHMCCGPSGYETGLSELATGPSSLLVTKNMVIAPGTVLGTMGNTGNSDGSHLHWEVRICPKDKPCYAVDPSSVYLPGQYEYCDWEGFPQTTPEDHSWNTEELIYSGDIYTPEVENTPEVIIVPDVLLGTEE